MQITIADKPFQIFTRKKYGDITRLFRKAGYKTRYGATNYPLRDCPFCGIAIPNINKNGGKIVAGVYKKKKTCGETECYSKLFRGIKP